MNRPLILVTLFLGGLVCTHKAEAMVRHAHIFKGLEAAPGSNHPWDPRIDADRTGREEPVPQQSPEEQH